jgi:hypothetical protein
MASFEVPFDDSKDFRRKSDSYHGDSHTIRTGVFPKPKNSILKVIRPYDGQVYGASVVDDFIGYQKTPIASYHDFPVNDPEGLLEVLEKNATQQSKRFDKVTNTEIYSYQIPISGFIEERITSKKFIEPTEKSDKDRVTYELYLPRGEYRKLYSKIPDKFIKETRYSRRMRSENHHVKMKEKKNEIKSKMNDDE